MVCIAPLGSEQLVVSDQNHLRFTLCHECTVRLAYIGGLAAPRETEREGDKEREREIERERDLTS